jgi:UrcA family protein
MNVLSLERRKLLGFALYCAVALSGARAFSAPGDSPGPSIDIKYSRSEFERHDGVASVYRRILTAARIVCVEPDLRELSRYSKYRECYQRAVDAAVATIGDVRLTAMHRSGVGPLASAAPPAGPVQKAAATTEQVRP